MNGFAVACLMLTSVAHAQKGVEVVGVGDAGQEVTGQKRAVIIGINDYDTVSDLQYCVADARGLFEALTGPSCGFPARNVRLLVDDAPDRADRPNQGNIVGALSNWLTLPKENDLVLVYFSGHGKDEGDESYLLPSSAQEAAPALTGLPLKYVREQLRLCRAQRKLLLVDMCHGGGKGISVMSGTAQRILAQTKGMLTLASCQVEEKSYEWPDKGHSVFSYYLLEALSGRGGADRDKDGWLSTDEVYDYVHENVVRWSKKYGQSQTPQMQGERTGKIVLGLAGLGAPAVVEDLTTTATVRITSTPNGAEVYIGGQRQGTTPCQVTVDLGARESTTLDVIVEQTGYRSKGGRLTVRRGQTIPWDMELERLEPTRPTPPVVRPPITPPTGGVPGQTKLNPVDGAELVFIPGGTFQMGSNDGDDDEKPVHQVTVSGFWMYAKEVTNGQYRKFLAANPEWTPERIDSQLHDGGYLKHCKEQSGASKDDSYPVAYVPWHAAKAYAEWAGGRLPTEAEWEYAARGGRQFEYGTATGELSEQLANYGAGTKPVGSYRPNPFGLYDLAGNVWEWCQDWYGEYPDRAVSDPQGASTGVGRVARGGSWNNDPRYCRSTDRNRDTSKFCIINLGFRPVLAPPG